jgi:arylsulfatase A-like enzyme
VLFIVVDTLRADHLPLYGYATGNTPNLDQFAKDAVRFDAAFANASWTRPSFASILTGRYPASHRTMSKADALPDEVVTLPEALRDAGYATRGIATNFNVAPFFNFQQGFDEYRYLEPNFVLGANDTAAKLLFIQFLRQRIETVRAKSGRVEVGSAYQDASVVNRNLLEMLDAGPKAPWFMFAGYMDPHDPYYPHPYDGTAYARAAHQEPNPDEAPALRKLYDGEITFWDEHFGALIAELKKRGVYDELTIILTADHGEEFHEHGGFWHGTTLYDEQVRVPLLVKLPGGEMRGNTVRHWVQSIDLMPTLLQRAGVTVPEGVQGRDVFAGNKEVFAEESHEGNVLRALRIDRAGAQMKLITANPGNPRGLAPREFYRIDQDPKERVNLAEEEPALVEFTRKALDKHEEDAAKGRASQQSVDVGSDANAAARLRALGYAGGDKPEDGDKPN